MEEVKEEVSGGFLLTSFCRSESCISYKKIYEKAYGNGKKTI